MSESGVMDKEFCKIFESDKAGQILLMCDECEETGVPVLSIVAKPGNDDVNLLFLNLKFSDEERRGAAFSSMSLEQVERIIVPVLERMEVA